MSLAMKKEKPVHLTPALSPARRGSDVAVASEGYLDKVAVARRLGVKPKTVGEWANQGRLPAYRLGPYLRFKWAEVEAHLAATCQLKRGVRSAERGNQNGEFRHLTPTLSPIEAERERKTRI